MQMIRSHLTNLRYERTLRANRVKRQIEWMLTSEAPFRMANNLPSWWPFWSDSLHHQVVELIHVGRELQTEEGYSND